MEIPLKTRLKITFHNEKDEKPAELLAILVDKKLKERKYEKRINDILAEVAEECLKETP